MQLSFDDILREDDWPITITNYLHDDYQLDEMIEWLREDEELPPSRVEEFAQKIKDLCYEVAIDIECHKDGTCKIKGIR